MNNLLLILRAASLLIDGGEEVYDEVHGIVLRLEAKKRLERMAARQAQATGQAAGVAAKASSDALEASMRQGTR
jgi:hypothetical protein